MSHGLKKPHHKARLLPGAKLDLSMWWEFLQHFNGVSPFRDQGWFDNDALELFTDAAGGIGFGVFFNGHWFQGKWYPKFLQLTIDSIL